MSCTCGGLIAQSFLIQCLQSILIRYPQLPMFSNGGNSSCFCTFLYTAQFDMSSICMLTTSSDLMLVICCFQTSSICTVTQDPQFSFVVHRFCDTHLGKLTCTI